MLDKPIQVGEMSVRICHERETLPLPIEMVVPNADTDWLDQNRAWLEPKYADLLQQTLNLSFHSYVLQTGGLNVLIDACIGNDKERGDVEFFHQQRSPYLQNLQRLGLAPEDIDVVLCTHMHADHVGWNTRLEDGSWVPTFPRARYVFSQREYDHWKSEYQVDPMANQGSFADSVLPVVASGQSELVDDGYELSSGIAIEAAPGHTPGNIVVRARSGSARALFSGDIVHHPIQVHRPEWSSGFCLDPVASARTRKDLLDSVADTDTLVFPAHFCSPTVGRVVGGENGDTFAWRWQQSDA